MENYKQIKVDLNIDSAIYFFLICLYICHRAIPVARTCKVKFSGSFTIAHIKSFNASIHTLKGTPKQGR